MVDKEERECRTDLFLCKLKELFDLIDSFTQDDKDRVLCKLSSVGIYRNYLYWMLDKEEKVKEVEPDKLEPYYINCGKRVRNKNSGAVGIVLREFKTGQVQVLERMEPMVINTHDSWKTLELVDDIT